MSLEAITLVRTLPRRGIHLPPRDRFVLYALADFADDNLRAWPAHRTIIEWTGYARATVIEALTSLEEAGVIRAERRSREDGGMTSNVYVLIPHPPVRLADTPVREPDTPPVREPDHPVTPAGHPPVREPDTMNHHLEPPKNPQTPTPPADSRDEDGEDARTVEADLASAALASATAVERRRARSHATSLLAQQHPAVHATLQDLQGIYKWNAGRYQAIADRVLELAREHGTERTAAALDAVVISGADIKQPLAYAAKILRDTPAATPASARPEYDLDAMFTVDRRVN